MSYVVTGPLVLARDKEGKTHHCYEGAVISWLSDEQAAHLLDTGLVRELVGDSGDDGGKPARTAVKADLVSWLVDNAVDEDGNDYDADELEKLNKDQLWERLDAVED